MRISEKNRIFQKAYHIIKNIDSDRDLNKLNLTISDYNDICAALREISDLKSWTTTIQSNVKDFFANCGFTVSVHGIGWKIGF